MSSRYREAGTVFGLFSNMQECRVTQQHCGHSVMKLEMYREKQTYKLFTSYADFDWISYLMKSAASDENRW